MPLRLRTVSCLLLSPLVPLCLLNLLLRYSPAQLFDGASASTTVIRVIPVPSVTTAAASMLRLPMTLPYVPDTALASAMAAAPLPTADASDASAHETAGYVPAALLSERPHALPEIVYDGLQPMLSQPIECVLLISEHGDVDRVLFNHAALTPLQQQTLRDHLGTIRFTPGRLYGRAVKTAWRIELRLH